MTNHVDLLLGTGEEVATDGAADQGRGATRYRNPLEAPSGRVWEGWYRSNPVQPEFSLYAFT